MSDELRKASLVELQTRMAQGELTAQELVQVFLDAIHGLDKRLGSVIEVNPEALATAEALDQERRKGRVRGPLHGIPVLLKDNIDTDDGTLTTAGSLALVSSRPSQEATVAARLREAGAILMGKANMSEWANFRSTRSTSGWSARGGQCRNPHRLSHNPCGSSSGSGAAVAAHLVPVSLGTETDGSIVCPSAVCGIVGIKPTVGLTSRAGVIPVAHSQDTVGPMARTVADAALVLGALVGPDGRDPATAASQGHYHRDYTRFLDPEGLRGARIGVPRRRFFGYHPATDAVIEQALAAMEDAGAILVDPADIPTATDDRLREAEFQVLLTEFKHDIAAYLATRIPLPTAELPTPRTLEDLIRFNQEYADLEMPHFGQEIFEMAQEKGGLDDPAYQEARALSHQLAAVEGLDATLDAHQLDALVAPTTSPAWPIDYEQGDRYLGSSSQLAAMAGYPLITVPAGFVDGLPVGITFMGRAWSEPTLIRLAYAFEQATQARRPPPEFIV